MVIKDPMDHSLSSIYPYYVMKAIYCVKIYGELRHKFASFLIDVFMKGDV